MGIITRTARSAGSFLNLSSPASFAPLSISPWQQGRAQLPDANYETYAREGYAQNELVYACIEELATSAAEPRMHARKRRTWTLEHPILDLFRRPNPFMDGFEFWSTVILHRAIAGNAYALKIRSSSGKVLELWLMRPDRVRIVPDRAKYISRYEYEVSGGESVEIPVTDVIHWKTRNPLNDFYGMPPLAAISARIDIDNYMRDFVKSFFANAGVPAGMLAIKQKLGDGAREEIKRRFRHDYGGPSGWHDLLVLDQTEATFTPMTQNLGPSALGVAEMDKAQARRVCMAFQVPPALIGADDAPTSYAALEMIQRFFWDNTLAPLYKDLQGALNVNLLADFAGVDEVAFDLSDVRALAEDVDKVHARLRGDLMAGGITIEEFRAATGRPEKVTSGTFLLPANLVPVAASKVADDSVDLSSVRAGEPAPPAAGG